MKRLYSLLMLALVAVTAMASAPRFKANLRPTPASVANLTRAAHSRAEADQGSIYDGSYILTIGDYYRFPSNGRVEIEVKLVVENGVAHIDDPSEQWFLTTVEAPINEETGVMTFSNAYLGELEYTDGTFDAISFMPIRYDVKSEEFSFPGEFSVTYDPQTRSFEFPADASYGFSWVYWNSGNSADYVANAQAFTKPDSYYRIFDVEALDRASQTWTSLGMGRWFEGLLPIFDGIDEGWSWPVEIQQCDQTPGLYRMRPYAVADNPVAQLIGSIDYNTLIIIDATNPEKVFTVGDFQPYNMITFSGLNVENDFPDTYRYGTLTDKIISFPNDSFAYYDKDEDRWYAYSRDFKIALPGAEVKDYKLKATTEFACSEGAETTVNLIAGADIAKTYMHVYKGYADAAYGDNGNKVVANGTEVTLGAKLTFATPDERGHYSIMFAGVDADNKVVATAVTYQVVDGENDADWRDVPETTTRFTEGFLAGMFGNIDPEEFDVVLQENVTTPGRFRFEAPYANHSMAQYLTMANHSKAHKHYIYVNATDPAAVYVEPSTLGFAVPGYDAIYVHPHKDFGTFANGVIEAPAYVSSNNVAKNYSGGSIRLVIKSNSAINEIADTADSDTRIFDLQGRRLAAPTRGLNIINNHKVIR